MSNAISPFNGREICRDAIDPSIRWNGNLEFDGKYWFSAFGLGEEVVEHKKTKLFSMIKSWDQHLLAS